MQIFRLAGRSKRQDCQDGGRQSHSFWIETFKVYNCIHDNRRRRSTVANIIQLISAFSFSHFQFDAEVPMEQEC